MEIYKTNDIETNYELRFNLKLIEFNSIMFTIKFNVILLEIKVVPDFTH